MAKLIDKDALIAEIERLYDEKGTFYAADVLYNLKEWLDTLEVKEVDLDDFIKEEFNKYSCVDGYGQLSVSYNMAEFYGMIKRLTKVRKGEVI